MLEVETLSTRIVADATQYIDTMSRVDVIQAQTVRNFVGSGVEINRSATNWIAFGAAAERGAAQAVKAAQDASNAIRNMATPGPANVPGGAGGGGPSVPGGTGATRAVNEGAVALRNYGSAANFATEQARQSTTAWRNHGSAANFATEHFQSNTMSLNGATVATMGLSEASKAAIATMNATATATASTASQLMAMGATALSTARSLLGMIPGLSAVTAGLASMASGAGGAIRSFLSLIPGSATLANSLRGITSTATGAARSLMGMLPSGDSVRSMFSGIQVAITGSIRSMLGVASSTTSAVGGLSGLSGAGNAAVGAMRGMVSGGSSASSAIASMGLSAGPAAIAVAALLVALAGIATLKWSVSLAADVQSATTSFRVLMGDAEMAEMTVQRIRNLAAETPMTSGPLMGLGTQLLNARVHADQLIPTLRMLGDAAMGNENKMRLLTKAYTDTKGYGVLKLGEVRQFTENGVGIVAALQEHFNKLGNTTEYTFGRIYEMISDGSVTFDDMNAALKGMTSEGGKNFGAMAEASQDLWGRVSTLKDLFEIFGSDLGAVFMPLAVGGVEDLIVVVQWAGRVTQVLSAAISENGEKIGFLNNRLKEAIPLYGTAANAWAYMISMMKPDANEQAVLDGIAMARRMGEDALAGQAEAAAKEQQAKDKAIDDARHEREEAAEQKTKDEEKARKASQKAFDDTNADIEKAERDHQQSMRAMRNQWSSEREKDENKLDELHRQATTDEQFAEIDMLERTMREQRAMREAAKADADKKKEEAAALKKEQKEAETAQKKYADDAADDAKKIAEKYMTPLEKMNKEAARLAELKSMGLIDEKQLALALEDLKEIERQANRMKIDFGLDQVQIDRLAAQSMRSSTPPAAGPVGAGGVSHWGGGPIPPVTPAGNAASPPVPVVPPASGGNGFPPGEVGPANPPSPVRSFPPGEIGRAASNAPPSTNQTTASQAEKQIELLGNIATYTLRMRDIEEARLAKPVVIEEYKLT